VSSLLRTPQATDAACGYKGERDVVARGHQPRVGDQIVDLMNGQTTHYVEWGKFKPAIQRWEDVFGHPAPHPAYPDGKDGQYRLSSAFSEWMMGLPRGWVTDVGLSRSQELRALGNGVVPQQAEHALKSLLTNTQHDTATPKMPVLPTPTVSNIYDDSFTSKQHKGDGSRSVSLAQMVRRLVKSFKD